MKKQLCFAAVILGTSGLALADRTPVYLSGGGGFGAHGLTSDSSLGEVETEASTGLLRSLKAGFMLNDRNALYLHARSSNFDYETEDTGTEFKDARATLVGLGYTHYTSATEGSPYFEVTAGMAGFNVDDNGFDIESKGRGLLVGAGYEFNRHVQMGAVYTLAETEDDDDDDTTYTTNSLGLKVELKL
ncbi:outer membrane beta-barrel protein [Saccharospirillum mangrovi]|uniref:outer membrane beta-barrel protein n=1 Tax=Saccharospirillum mangrovi TaxID=2161747 RepID=UPI000D3924A4|nr:outer membrane beta-barrel protein [Saccharospirillum mangrovi]